MRIQKHITQFIALSLAVLMLGATMPVSAAEIAAPANIGSVSAVGSVQLRGVGVSEGTLFSGDRLNVAPGAYAKVVFGAGPKVEVDGSSDVTVSKDANAINIQMSSGNIAFTGNAQKPVRVRLGVWEIATTNQARGSVAFVGSEAFGVRVMDGTVSVRNTATKESFTVTKGTAKIVSLRGDSTQSSGVLLASSVPTAIPPAPAMPRQSSGGKRAALLIGAVLGSAAAIAVLMTKNDDTDQEAALRLQKTSSSQSISAATTTAGEAASAATQIVAVTNNVNAAIANSSLTPAAKKTLTDQAAALTAKTITLGQTVAQLQGQLISFQTQLDGASGAQVTAIQTQISTLIGSLNGAVNDLNANVDALNALIQQATAAGVPNVPNTVIQKVDEVSHPSPSTP